MYDINFKRKILSQLDSEFNSIPQEEYESYSLFYNSWVVKVRVSNKGWDFLHRAYYLCKNVYEIRNNFV